MRPRKLVIILLALATSACLSGAVLAGVIRDDALRRLPPKKPESEEGIEERLDGLSFEAVTERDTEAFKDRYDLLVKNLNEESYLTILVITRSHGSKYGEAYPVERLQPYLYSEGGGKRVLVALLVFINTYCLHPEARALVLREGERDEPCSSFLLRPGRVGYLPNELDLEARELMGEEQETWRELSAPEKWHRLCEFWKENGGQISELPEASEGEQALSMAARRGDLDRLRELIDQGADVQGMDANYEFPLQLATRWGHTEAMSLLLDAGASPNANYEHWTMLHEASANGCEDAVELLLSRGAVVNVLDDQLRTALTLCVPVGSTKVARALIKHGAEVQVSWLHGTWLLQWACEEGDPELVKMIIDHGGLVNARDKVFRTALHYAARGQSVEVMNILIQNGGWVDASDWLGWTPLHEAILKQRLPIAEALLEAGADPDHASRGGSTPSSTAREKGNKELIALLEEYGAKSEE